MKSLENFSRVGGESNEYARQWKEKNRGKAVGYLCSYVPEELIMAAGALPFRVFGAGTREDTSLAYSYLPSYSCSIVRNVLEDGVSGQLDFLDGVIFPHTCDAIMRLSDIWRLNVKFGFHSDLLTPSKLNAESSEKYMEAILRKLRKELEEKLETSIDDKKISDAIKACNQIKEKMARLYEISAANPELLSIFDIHAATSAAMIMDRQELSQELDALLNDLDNQTPPPKASPAKKRVMITGAVCHMADLCPNPEELEMNVVWDDLCVGSKYFQTMTDEDGDPIKAIADRYLNRIICPAKHHGVATRGEHLVKKAKDAKAEGVIFLLQKFCDPHSFDYPYVRDALKEENIPSLLVELEGGGGEKDEQLKTRLQAFLEML